LCQQPNQDGKHQWADAVIQLENLILFNFLNVCMI
jgi:hypothetical protein